MIIWIIYLLKSTLIFSLLYFTFRLLIRTETQFQQGRVVLLLTVMFSLVIPVTNLPESFPSIIQKDPGQIFVQPILEEPSVINEVEEYSRSINSSESLQVLTASPKMLSIELVVASVYLSGVMISIGLFLYRLASVCRLIKKSRRIKEHGIWINVVTQDIPTFSFGRYIVMSKQDFETNNKAILTHELSHIRQGHFYDLMLMELTKMVFWFNPLVYLMSRDIRQIHEYLADEATIKSGIDAIKYQLLIIQKSVGHQRFALATSFNHCQIKNRITMMNKSKNKKRWSWKVATFLPLLVFFLMAFGRKGEKPPEIVNLPIENPLENIISSAETEQNQYDEFKQKIEIRKDGNYINNKRVSLEEIKDQDRSWREASNAAILLLVDKSIPLNRIDEVRESLKGQYWVVQTTVGSDELIYFAGDVNKLAELKKGKFRDWFRDQLKKYPETQSKNYRISFSIIVDKNGKARDGHLIEGCEFSEINDAYNKILSDIPDWNPAKRLNENVSVYWKYMHINSVDKNN